MSTALAGIVATLQARADAPVVEYRNRWFTGAEILRRTEARAADLVKAGAKPGDTVLIVVSDNLSATEMLIACWYAGASGCLVDFRTPPDRLAEWSARLNSALAVGTRAVSGFSLHLQPADPDPADRPPPVPHAAPDDAAIVFMSSGTTGPPKFRFRSQGQLGRAVGDFVGRFDITPDGAALCATSAAYSASAFRCLICLTIGKPLVLMDVVHSLGELDAMLRRPDITDCNLPPNIIRRLAALPGPVPRYPQLARLASVGGPASPDDKVAAVTRLSPNYSMTYSATGVGVMTCICGPEVLARPASCGRPFDDVEITIRNGARVCPPNETGLIVVSTPLVKNAIPGDLGWLDEDGYLFIAGREQGLLCRNGANFSAERIRMAALCLPQVEEAAVFATPDADGADRVHLAVQCGQRDIAEIEKAVKRLLPASEYPDRIHLCDAIPLNVAGKIDLETLRRDLSLSQAPAEHAG